MICEDKKYNNINDHINKILRKNVFDKKINNINLCPYCSSKRIIKYGKFKGIQRFKCKECRKTFSLVTNTTWSYSKKEPVKWIKFIELILEKKVLRECAEILDININTAFAWRHKVLKGITKIENKTILEGAIHMTKVSVKENFKGSRKINTEKRQNVLVVSAKGDKDTMISIPVCKKLWNWRAFEEKVCSRITKTSYIIPYLDRYIFCAAKRYNSGSQKIITEENQLIKNFNVVYKNWFKLFNGVATKYLKYYLSWFILFFREKTFKDVDLFYELD